MIIIYICVTSSLDKSEIWFDKDNFVAMSQNVDKFTRKHLSTDIYLALGNESLRFNVIDTPSEIIDVMTE